MKPIYPFSVLLCAATLALHAQEAQQLKLSVEIENNWSQPKTDEPVIIRLDEIKPAFPIRSAIVTDGTVEIPSQLDDLDGDLRFDELAFVIDMPAHAAKPVSVTLSSARPIRQYTPRVYAEMLARDSKKGKYVPIQSVTVPGNVNSYNMLQHHGSAFESELVAYRIYFDKKQTLDPYGKFHKRLEIEESQFYPTDEQLARGFGDDVLMVGNSCGIGALKGWNGSAATHIEPVMSRTERILAYGPIRTITEVIAKGWEYQGRELDMTNRYILYAGHRDLRVETYFTEQLGDEMFCTGVQRIMGNETISFSDHQGLVGSWGRHWPVNDTIKYAKETIGIATCIPASYVGEEVEDADNFLYTLSAPGNKSFHYYTMFTSRKETFGYPTPEAWFAYLKEWKEALQHPVNVKVSIE